MLRVTFPAVLGNTSDVNRFMGCSGGWDWAMYSNVFDARGRRILSRGIWKDVTLVMGDPIVESVVPVVYSRAPGVFAVNVTLHLRPGRRPSQLRIDTAWGDSGTIAVAVNLTQATLMFNVYVARNWVARICRSRLLSCCRKSSSVALWRVGQRNKLYWVRVWSGNDLLAERRVGFRTVALVSHGPTLAGNATGNFTMRFVINGEAVLLRGCNVIPTSAFEGLVDDRDLRAMVESAARAGMNVLRVWGGGVYGYTAFYDACDELGIVVYQGEQGAKYGHFPADAL